jgi:hypothetical protein
MIVGTLTLEDVPMLMVAVAPGATSNQLPATVHVPPLGQT